MNHNAITSETSVQSVRNSGALSNQTFGSCFPARGASWQKEERMTVVKVIVCGFRFLDKQPAQSSLDSEGRRTLFWKKGSVQNAATSITSHGMQALCHLCLWTQNIFLTHFGYGSSNSVGTIKELGPDHQRSLGNSNNPGHFTVSQQRGSSLGKGFYYRFFRKFFL